MKAQVKIFNQWVTPPTENVEAWLNEIVCCDLDKSNLTVRRHIRRFELITAFRKSARHKEERIKVVP